MARLLDSTWQTFNLTGEDCGWIGRILLICCRIPKNLRFRIQDYESPWTFGEGSKDMIHLRMGCGSVSSWPELYQKIHEYVESPKCRNRLTESRTLKPGTGCFEQVEIDYEPRCDDGTMPPNSALKHWYECLRGATELASRPIAYDHNTKQMLEHAGFTNIQRTVIRVPLNSWCLSPFEKDVGRWWNLAMTDGLGLEALSLGPFTRIYKWQADDVARLVKDAKKEMCTRKYHIYNHL
jgi:hypothetical protein